MPTFYLDPENGNDAADGSTFALGGLPAVGPWQTITGGPTAARIAPGDVIRIAKSPDPTSLGQTALFTDLSRAVVLQTGVVTAHVSTCDYAAEAWTNGANATCSSQTAQYKLGSDNGKAANRTLQIVIGAAAGTTELLAYRDLGAGGIDFSGYQQISFWIRNTVAITAGMLKLVLCSDQSGAVIVDSFAIPAIPSVNQWVPITVNKGSALGSAIKSVALYSDTVDPGIPTLLFDNIVACKAVASADSVTLTSLISKNSAAQGGTEPWYCIQSINGTSIYIDNHTNQLGNGGRGYTGTTETVTIYKRETIKTVMVASDDVQAIQDSGAAGSLIEFQGGYDTGTGLQTGETHFDGLNGAGNGINCNKSYFEINHVYTFRYKNGFYSNSVVYGRIIRNGGGASCHEYIIMFRDSYAPITLEGTIKMVNAAVMCISASHIISRSGLIIAYGTGQSCMSAAKLELNEYIGKNTNHNPMTNVVQAKIRTLTTDTDPFRTPGAGARLAVGSFTLTAGSHIDITNDAIISYDAYGGVSTDKRIYRNVGIIYSETSVRHTASGLAWKFNPNVNASIVVPLILPVAEVAVNASALVTVKAWLRRSHTGLTLSLVCRGGQIAGVDNDVVASMTAAADTWEEVTITFTPTAAGVVEIEVQAYGGTTYSGYVDDLSVSQA